MWRLPLSMRRRRVGSRVVSSNLVPQARIGPDSLRLGPDSVRQDNSRRRPRHRESSTLHNVHYRRFEGQALTSGRNGCCPVLRKMANLTDPVGRRGGRRLIRQEPETARPPGRCAPGRGQPRASAESASSLQQRRHLVSLLYLIHRRLQRVARDFDPAPSIIGTCQRTPHAMENAMPTCPWNLASCQTASSSSMPRRSRG
jgi:hypothetical protein